MDFILFFFFFFFFLHIIFPHNSKSCELNILCNDLTELAFSIPNTETPSRSAVPKPHYDGSTYVPYNRSAIAYRVGLTVSSTLLWWYLATAQPTLKHGSRVLMVDYHIPYKVISWSTCISWNNLIYITEPMASLFNPGYCIPELYLPRSWDDGKMSNFLTRWADLASNTKSDDPLVATTTTSPTERIWSGLLRHLSRKMEPCWMGKIQWCNCN